MALVVPISNGTLMVTYISTTYVTQQPAGTPLTEHTSTAHVIQHPPETHRRPTPVRWSLPSSRTRAATFSGDLRANRYAGRRSESLEGATDAIC